ncbi:MAG: hypothetical protein ACRCYU_23610 [Nocardioides sp.]
MRAGASLLGAVWAGDKLTGNLSIDLRSGRETRRLRLEQLLGYRYVSLPAGVQADI